MNIMMFFLANEHHDVPASEQRQHHRRVHVPAGHMKSRRHQQPAASASAKVTTTNVDIGIAAPNNSDAGQEAKSRVTR